MSIRARQFRMIVKYWVNIYTAKHAIRQAYHVVCDGCFNLWCKDISFFVTVLMTTLSPGSFLSVWPKSYVVDGPGSLPAIPFFYNMHKEKS